MGGMGSHPIDPANLQAYYVLMIMGYVTGVAGFIYGVFGIVRTAATKLPVPMNRATNELFPIDMGPKLYSFDGNGRKALKIVIFTVVLLLFGAVWLDILYFTYLAGDEWFAWSPTLSVWLTLVIHALALLTFTAPFAARARSYANKFALFPS